MNSLHSSLSTRRTRSWLTNAALIVLGGTTLGTAITLDVESPGKPSITSIGSGRDTSAQFWSVARIWLIIKC